MRKVLLFLGLVTLSTSCTKDELFYFEGITYHVKGSITVVSTVKDGLVAWYPFNGNANDESGNSNNGIVTGAVLTANKLGKPNSAYLFNNSTSNNEKRIEATINTSSITTGLSIAWWVKRNGNGYISPRVFEFWPGAETEGKFASNIRNNENSMIFNHNIAGKDVTFSIPYSSTNEWVHYVYTVGNGEAKFYINGQLAYTQTINISPIKLGNKVAFGRMNHPLYDAFNGILDDIAVYNRVITQSEVNYYYNYKD